LTRHFHQKRLRQNDRERNRWKAIVWTLSDVPGRELNDLADAVVIDVLNDRYDQVTLIPSLARFSIARTFTSNKLTDATMLFFFLRRRRTASRHRAGRRPSSFAKLNVFGRNGFHSSRPGAIEADLLCHKRQLRDNQARSFGFRRPKKRMMTWRRGLNDTSAV